MYAFSYVFFSSDKSLKDLFRFKRITWALLLLSKKKYIGYHARLRENELLFRCQALLVENFFRFARAGAHLRALMMQKTVRNRDAQRNTEESP